MTYVIEPLDRHHNRAAFSCGHPELDDWFQRRASQDERRNIARVFVALDDDKSIVGFYTLSSFTITLQDFPPELSNKLPRYDAIPAALIGRLARDGRVRGNGIGKLLIADALRRILGAAQSLAVFAIVVDAKDEKAIEFYRKFGFRIFPANPRRLFLLTSSATAAIGKS